MYIQPAWNSRSGTATRFTCSTELLATIFYAACLHIDVPKKTQTCTALFIKHASRLIYISSGVEVQSVTTCNWMKEYNSRHEDLSGQDTRACLSALLTLLVLWSQIHTRTVASQDSCILCRVGHRAVNFGVCLHAHGNYALVGEAPKAYGSCCV